MKKESYPAWTIITYEFAAKGDRPAVKIVWYDGGKLPPRPAGLEPDRKLADNGIYFVGDRGTMLCGGWSGPPRLVPESKMKDLVRPAEDHSPLDRPSRRVDPGLQAREARRTPRPGSTTPARSPRPCLVGNLGGPLAEADRVGQRGHEGHQRPRGRCADSQDLSQRLRNMRTASKWICVMPGGVQPNL